MARSSRHVNELNFDKSLSRLLLWRSLFAQCFEVASLGRQSISSVAIESFVGRFRRPDAGVRG